MPLFRFHLLDRETFSGIEESGAKKSLAFDLPLSTVDQMPVESVAAYNSEDKRLVNDDQNIGETQRLSSENAPRSRGTNGRKIVLTFLGACGLMLAICCGIAFYGQSTTNDPTEITTFQKEIVEIDLPANLYPGMGISRPLSLTKMKMAFYNPKQATSLMLIGFLDDAEHDYERSMKSCRVSPQSASFCG